MAGPGQLVVTLKKEYAQLVEEIKRKHPEYENEDTQVVYAALDLLKAKLAHLREHPPASQKSVDEVKEGLRRIEELIAKRPRA